VFLKQEKGFDPKSESYRTVLAAHKLELAIEKYVDARHDKVEDKSLGFMTLKQRIPDSVLGQNVRNAAIQYFMAHYPVSKFGARPGPASSLDPDFAGYVQMLRKYGLTMGTLLHEEDFLSQ
jgi:hypothetical protein